MSKLEDNVNEILGIEKKKTLYKYLTLNNECQTVDKEKLMKIKQILIMIIHTAEITIII